MSAGEVIDRISRNFRPKSDSRRQECCAFAPASIAQGMFAWLEASPSMIRATYFSVGDCFVETTRTSAALADVVA
jgi:hypothetical protein